MGLSTFECCQLAFGGFCVIVTLGGWIWMMAKVRFYVNSNSGRIRELTRNYEDYRKRQEEAHAVMWQQINQNRANVAALRGSNGP